jgi:hypothetical protein
MDRIRRKEKEKIGRYKKERREREEVQERAENGISCLGYVAVV